MKKQLLKLILLGLLYFVANNLLVSQNLQNKKQLTDRFGRVVQTELGEKVEYLELPDIQDDTIIRRNKSEKNRASAISCEPVWTQGIMGTCIGENSMLSLDYDDDGIVEIICSGGGGFGSGSFWYIMEYDNLSNSYNQVWISEFYVEYSEKVTTISAYDIDADNKYEIFLGFANESVEILDSELNTIAFLEPTNSYYGEDIKSILYADVRNTGTKEIAFSTSENTWVYNASSFTKILELEYGANDMVAGDVDGDSYTELVYSNGEVIQVTNNTSNFEWDFHTESGEGYLELLDVDSDGMEEIIFARYWYNIIVYDANLQSPKYEIESDLDIDALATYDVDNDGVKEILYGDGQWGNIYCHNSANGLLKWTIDNPDHGTTDISVGDVDNDGNLEVMWGSGCSSTGSDHLYIHDAASQQYEYSTIHIDAPFYAIEIADVNDDGIVEIVTLSYESGSGYDSGILSVFNSETYELLWQSDGDFLYGCWTGMFGVESDDIDNDGDTEIIVAAGETYDGMIWIINGSSFVIESSHEYFSQDIDEFYAFGVGDPDNDSQKEIVAANDNNIYVINPLTYDVEWKSVDLGYGQPKSVLVENVNNDPSEEIIVCKNKLYVINGVTHQQWSSNESNFLSLDTYDFDNDGILDIIASTSDGSVISINGETHEYTNILNNFNGPIQGVRIENIIGNESPELVFTSEGTVYFHKINGNTMSTQSFGTTAGSHDGLVISDYNNDGKKEVFVGTSYLAIELSSDCYECIDFSIDVIGQDLTCIEGDDGIVEVQVSGGTEPYNYKWNFGGTNALEDGLSAGTYSVTVTDGKGCVQSKEVTIEQSSLTSHTNSTDVGCTGINNGTISLTITQGTSPYNYEWNTGDTTSSLENLSPGLYNVSITDSKHCTNEHSIVIEQDEVYIHLNSENISCFGHSDGQIELLIISGTQPFNIQWSNGQTNSNLYYLEEGIYTVTVTDSLECNSTESVEITEPMEILVSGSSTPDFSTTPNLFEGTATVDAVGGTPPYFIIWNDPLQQTNPTAINLQAGFYRAYVKDARDCMVTFDVEVKGISSIDEHEFFAEMKVFPNPVNDIINFNFGFEEKQDINVKIYDAIGNLVIQREFNNVLNNTISQNVKFLPHGLYTVVIKVNDSKVLSKISVVR